jgi:hypothetical protein
MQPEAGSLIEIGFIGVRQDLVNVVYKSGYGAISSARPN